MRKMFTFSIFPFLIVAPSSIMKPNEDFQLVHEASSFIDISLPIAQQN